MLLRLVRKKYIIRLRELSSSFFHIIFWVITLKLKYLKDILVIYLKKDLINNINFNVKDELEKYFKYLFNRLNEYYYLEIKGFYNIKVYIDNSYGVVLELKKEDIDYYDYLDNSVDMRITIINEDFLYRLNDIDIVYKLCSKGKVYKYKNIFIIDKIPSSDYIKYSEFIDVIYDVKSIKKSLIAIDKMS